MASGTSFVANSQTLTYTAPATGVSKVMVLGASGSNGITIGGVPVTLSNVSMWGPFWVGPGASLAIVTGNTSTALVTVLEEYNG